MATSSEIDLSGLPNQGIDLSKLPVQEESKIDLSNLPVKSGNIFSKIPRTSPVELTVQKENYVQDRLKHVQGSPDFQGKMRKEFEGEWERGQHPLTNTMNTMFQAGMYAAVPEVVGGLGAAGGLMKAAQFAGGAGVFTGVDKLFQMAEQKILPQDTTPWVKDVIQALGMGVSAVGTGVITEGFGLMGKQSPEEVAADALKEYLDTGAEHHKARLNAVLDDVIDQHAKTTGQEHKAEEIKKAVRPSVEDFIKNIFKTKKKQDKADADFKTTFVDFGDINKGYVVNNKVVEGEVKETKINANPKSLIPFKAKAQDVLYNSILAMQGEQKREIKMPDMARNYFTRQIAMRLALKQNENEIMDAIVSGKIKRDNTIVLSNPTPDWTDPDITVFDMEHVREVRLTDYMSEKFAQGITPDKIELIQEVGALGKSHAQALRDNMDMRFKAGLKSGAYKLPEPPGEPTIAPTGPVAPQTPIEPVPDQAAAEEIVGRQEIPTEVSKVTPASPIDTEEGKASAKYFRGIEGHEAPITGLAGEHGWPKWDDPGSEDAMTVHRDWFEGSPHEGLIRYFYGQIKNAYDSLPDIAFHTERTNEWNVPPEEMGKRLHALEKAKAKYAEDYPEVKEFADHLNRLIEDMRTQQEYSSKVEEAQEGISKEVKDEMDRMSEAAAAKETGKRKPPVGPETPPKAKTESGTVRDVKDLYDELKDWNESLTPYQPVRAYKQESGKSMTSRIFAAKKTFEEALTKVKDTPEFKAAQELRLARVEELLDKMYPEQLETLQKDTGFDFTKLREKLPEFVKKLDQIVSTIDIRLAEDREMEGPPSLNPGLQNMTLATVDPIELATDKGYVTLAPGTYDLKDVEGKLMINVDGVDHVVDEFKWSGILKNPNVELRHEGMEMQCGLGPPLSRVGKALYQRFSPWGRYFKSRGAYKHPGLRRDPDVRIVLEIMRFFRVNEALKAKALRAIAHGRDVDRMMERKPKFGAAPESVKGKLYKDKVEIAQFQEIADMYSRKRTNELESLLKKVAESKGIKGAAFNQFRDTIMGVGSSVPGLLNDAAEQVSVGADYRETGKVAETDSARSKHINNEGMLDPQQAKNYHDAIVDFRQRLGLPIDPKEQVKWADPNGVREPVFWNMLQEVTGDDSLQKWLLDWKCDEAFLLEERMARGVFDKTDMYENQKYGYTKRIFAPELAQEELWGGGKKPQKSSAETTRKEHADTRNFQDFRAKGKAKGYKPVENFLLSMNEYVRESLVDCHQADVQGELLKEEVPLIHRGTTKIDQGSLRKVSSDPVTAPVILHKSHDIVQAEVAKLKKAGIDIDADGVLASWGYIKGREMPGFTEWYRGAWQAPYVYRPVADVFKAMFEPIERDFGAGALGRTAVNIADAQKFIRLANPYPHLPIFGAQVYMVRLWRFVTSLPFKALGVIPKAAYFGVGILRGKYDYGLSPEEFPHLDKMIMGGTPVNFRNIFNSVWDATATDRIPELNSFKDNVKAFIYSQGGLGKALWEDWLGKEIAGAWEYKYKQFKSQNMLDSEAAWRASQTMQQLSYFLNRAIYNKEGPLARLLLVSRNLRIGTMRNIALLAYTPFKSVNKAWDYTGLYKYHTSELGRLFNSSLTGEMTPQDRAVISAEVWKSMAKLAAAKVVFNGLAQWMYSYEDDDQVDEYGEKGNDPSTWKNGKYPRKRDIFENPHTAFLKIRMPHKDIYNRRVYNDTHYFRVINDLQDVLLGPVGPWKPLGKMSEKGRGIYKWALGGKNLWITSLENLANNKSMDYGPMYDPKADGWSQFTDGLGASMHELELIGSAPRTSMQDPKLNAFYRWFNKLGGQTTTSPHSLTGTFTEEDADLLDEIKSKRVTEDKKQAVKMKAVPPGEEFKQGDIQAGIKEFMKRHKVDVQNYSEEDLMEFFKQKSKEK